MQRVFLFRSLIIVLLLACCAEFSAVWAVDGPLFDPAPLQTEAPTVAIDVWYGTTQSFGVLGSPQRQINILGNAKGASELSFSLNGGRDRELSIGSSGSRRLVAYGDFNIEIYTSELREGANTVLIKADGGEVTQEVTVNYTPGVVWESPYEIDWSQVANIPDVVQVVDGKWELDGIGVRPTTTGYDRLLAIGDLVWDEYEMTVPFRIHSFDVEDDGGVGILARWQGHYELFPGEQPASGWQRLGAYAYARERSIEQGDRHLRLLMSGSLWVDDNYRVRTRRDYIMKLRVQTKSPGQGGFYSFKVWEAADDEPASWNIEALDTSPDELDNGSLLLVAHRADVTFANVKIVPVLDLSVSGNGNGTVQISPRLEGTSDAYLYGDEITLTAMPDPGWAFTGWSGSLSGAESPTTFTLTEDANIIANFAPARNLDITIQGSGQVLIDPDLPVYGQGMVVTLGVAPDPGWAFDDWSGANAGDLQPLGGDTWSLLIDGDKALKATFVREYYDVTITTTGTGTGSVVVTPQGPYLYEQTVVLKPVPASSSMFSGWIGSDADKPVENPDGTWSVVVDGPIELVAEFDLNTYTLALETFPQDVGEILVAPDQAEFTHGQEVILTVVPEPGWRLSNWSGPSADEVTEVGDNTWSLLMDDDKSLRAVFSQETYTLTFVFLGRGSVLRTPNQTSYTYGQQVQLTPSPVNGWRFDRWDGDLVGDSSPATMVMDGNKRIRVVFRYNGAFLPLVIRSGG